MGSGTLPPLRHDDESDFFDERVDLASRLSKPSCGTSSQFSTGAKAGHRGLHELARNGKRTLEPSA
jgi:hypothetical protein